MRLHICYGNWEGPHIHDVPLATILPALYQAKVGALSIEFSNPRHAHEYEAFKKHPLPKDMLLIPGVVETTSNFVEHPEVVARRIEEAVRAVGERERVIASTDCGFGTFTNREWVIEPAVWLKLRAIREGADIASARLWGEEGGVAFIPPAAGGGAKEPGGGSANARAVFFDGPGQAGFPFSVSPKEGMERREGARGWRGPLWAALGETAAARLGEARLRGPALRDAAH